MGFGGSGGGGGSIAGSTDASVSAPSDGQLLRYNGTIGKWQNTASGIPFATVSLPGVLTTGTISLPFPIFGTWQFAALIVGAGTTPSGAAIVVDMLYNGTTIYTTQSNRPSISVGGLWGAGGTPDITQYSGSGSTRGYLQFAVSQVGASGTEGADLVATLYAIRVG